MSKPVSKGVIVQFTSDSEDEGNTSSSSARGSSKDPALSSDDERKGGKSAVTKTKQTKGTDKAAAFDDLPVLSTARVKNGTSSSAAESASSKPKKAAKSEETVKVEDAEERNLAPPSKSKTKSRSKSPKEESNVDEVKKISVDVSEERNLAPAAGRRRDKSPKETERVEEVKAETNLDDASDKGIKIKKKKKQTSEDKEEEVPVVDKTPEIIEVKADTSVKKKKSKEIEDSSLISPLSGVSEADRTATPPTDDTGKIHKKKASKQLAESPVNGEKDLEVPNSSVAPESPSLRRKKKKEATEDVIKTDLDLSVEKRNSAEILSNTEIISEEKPKKKKSVKSGVDVDAMLMKSTDDSVSASSEKRSEKPLEQAVQEKKVDTVLVNEVQDLPSSNITIVKPVNEETSKPSTEASKSSPEASKPSSVAPLVNGNVDTDKIKATAEGATDADEAMEEEARQARKKASEDLNDEVARYLESLPAYTKSVTADGIVGKDVTQPLEAEKPVTQAVDEQPVGEDENSEFTQRRQSMDDFIKKILAEAREERQKLKGNLEADASVLGKVDGGVGLPEMKDSTADKEGSMLERRLASVEMRRLKEGEESKVAAGRVRGGKDEEEDEITKIINARRSQRKAMEEGLDYDDVESIPSEAGSMRPRARRARDEYDDDESVSSSRPPLMPGGRVRSGRQQDEGSERGGESFVSKWRRERESSQLPEDSFAPRRSDQTDEVIRERTRHIRVIVEQQADIAKTMRATSRSMDELENEIREIRQMSLDWQARIEGLEGAIDTEYRQYEADQHAANERLRQQRVPDDRALREELRGIGRNRRVRGESVEDEGFVPGSRRRSGSVASTASMASSYMGGRGMDSGLEIDYYLGGGVGKRGEARRAESESDFSIDRLRRGGSLSRNISDMLGLPDNDDILGPRSRAGASRPGADSSSSAAPSVSDEVMRIRAKYSTLNNGPSSSSSSYAPSSRLSSGSDLGGSSYNFTTGYSSRRDPLSSTSRYGDTSGLSSLTSRYSSGLGDDYSSDSGRIRRAMSVSDMGYGGPSYRPSASSYGADSGSDFRSKYLSKVRSTKPDDYGSSSALSSRSKDKPFKSRFLKSSSAFSDSTPSRFGGGEGGASGAQGAE